MKARHGEEVQTVGLLTTGAGTPSVWVLWVWICRLNVSSVSSFVLSGFWL